MKEIEDQAREIEGEGLNDCLIVAGLRKGIQNLISSGVMTPTSLRAMLDYGFSDLYKSYILNIAIRVNQIQYSATQFNPTLLCGTDYAGRDRELSGAWKQANHILSDIWKCFSTRICPLASHDSASV
ncbi:MAG: hypothetical protein WCW17_03990 [Patescibacteria group bacterium]